MGSPRAGASGGQAHVHGPDCVRFNSPQKTITARWPGAVSTLSEQFAEFVMPTMK